MRATGAGRRQGTGPAAPGTPAGDEAGQADLLARVLAERAVRMVYQPLVELDTGAVVAYEALARGPAGSALERPDLLFAAARRARRLADLDVACRAAAVSGAAAAGLEAPYRLFLNAEPEALDGWRPGSGDPLVTVIVELTERALTSRPAQLLQTVARIRARGWGVALDDVGADPASLALLPMLRPDVIKLDLRLIQDQPTGSVAAVMNAVHAEAERSGTLVLAEGLETAEHVQVARSFGATLGQGWFFGRPGPLPAPMPPFTGRVPVRIVPRGDQVPLQSPFELGAAVREPRHALKPLLSEVSKQLEAQARYAGESAVVLATFQDHSFFTSATRRRYADLVEHTAFVGALGEGMPAEPLPGVRGAVITPTDPLRGEWDIAVLGPHFAATLVARDLGDTGPDRERRFEFVLSHDRELTVAVANVLMSRIWPEPKTADLPRLPDPAPVRLRGSGQPRPGSAVRVLAPADCPVELPSGLLERALDAATTGIAIADVRHPEQPLVWVNEAFSQLSGYAAEEVLGRNCRFLQGYRTDPRAVAEMGQAIAEGRELRTRLVNYRADGTPWWNDILVCPVHDAEGTVTHYIGVQADVTARVEAEEKVLHLAYHDALTGLPNRSRLAEALETALARARVDGSATALLFLDLDDFKIVNDRHGHSAGDDLLRQVAGRLRGTVRADDLLARQGGDEFLLLLVDLPPEGARAITDRVAGDLVTALSPPFSVGDATARIGTSIGVSVVVAGDARPDDVLRQADAAMYDAKAAGRNQHRHYADPVATGDRAGA